MITDLRLGTLAACLALCWAVAISIPTLRGPGDLFESFENMLFDWRVLTFGERDPPDDIVIVALDDATLATSTVGEERGQLTAIVEALAESGARVVALNFLLTDTGPEELDARLTEALEQVPTIIAGAAGGLTTGTGIGIPHTSQEHWPQPRFLDATSVGFVNVITEASGLPRYVPTVFATSRGIVPSFPLRAATRFAGIEPELGVGAVRLGTRSLRLDRGYLLPLRPYGPSGTIPPVSAVDFLSGQAAPAMAGKLVVLGNTATGMGDRFPSPFGGDLTGVEVIATAIGHFLEPVQVLTRSVATRRFDATLAAALALLCTLSVLTLPLAQGVSVAVVLILAGLSAVWLAFAYGVWLAAALPLAAAICPAVLAGMWRYSRERNQALATDRAMNELKKFQSPQLAQLVAADPGFLSSPETSRATILFVDLSGFTAMSQTLGPEDTELLLKRFHRCVTRIVHDNGGLVFNYMGDGALAVFGLLDGDGRPAAGAIDASFELVDDVRRLDEELEFQGRLSCRVGLHFGTVILSRLGGDLQQQFSVSGDSVNLASRLLEAAKEQRASIAATASTVEAMEMPDIRPPDLRRRITLRGRDGEVDILFWRN